MLAHSIAIMFFYHNFCRVHQTIKTTPAVDAGLAKRKGTVEEMVELLPILSYNTRPGKDAAGD